MGIAYNPKTVTDGLVLCLDAANSKSYPGTGTACTDLSGNGNNGTLSNGTTFSTSELGQFNFDGVNARITSPFAYELFLQYTLNVWFKCNSTKAFQVLIGGSIGNNMSMGIQVNSSSLLFHTYDTVDKTLLTVPNGVTLNTWSNVAACITYTSTPGSSSTSGIVKLYRNGSLLGSSAFSGVGTFNRSLMIASPSSNTFNRAFSGNISAISIYNKELSQQEIQQNFNATRGRYGI
jgi:hypothetical protein